MNNDLLIKSIDYIVSIPYFWSSMGMVTACSMIITVMMFDQGFKTIKANAISKFFFILTLLVVTIQRILQDYNTIPHHNFIYIPYSSLVTIILVSLFWFIGISLGMGFICIHKHKCGKNKKLDMKEICKR